MGTRLVTIATFDQVVQAQLSADALRAAGIDAVVADAEVVSMDWLLGQAVGGIKVQVREEDADRAVGELERAFGAGGERFDAPPPDAADAAEPDAEPRPTFELGPEDEIPPPPSPYSRDGYARRLVLMAWVGIILPPAWFVAFYFFLNALFTEGELTARGRFCLILAAVVLLFGMPMSYVFFFTLRYGM